MGLDSDVSSLVADQLKQYAEVAPDHYQPMMSSLEQASATAYLELAICEDDSSLQVELNFTEPYVKLIELNCTSSSFDSIVGSFAPTYDVDLFGMLHLYHIRPLVLQAHQHVP